MHGEHGKDDGHIWTVLVSCDHPHSSSHTQAYLFVQYARLGERDTAHVFHLSPGGKRKKYKATANTIGLYFFSLLIYFAMQVAIAHTTFSFPSDNRKTD